MVGVDPVGAISSEPGSRAKASEVVRGFVNRCDSERILMTTAFDEVQDTVDGLERVVEVRGVVEPTFMEECLANIEAVDTSR